MWHVKSSASFSSAHTNTCLCALSRTNWCSWQVANWQLVSSLKKVYLEYDLKAACPHTHKHTQKLTHTPSSCPLTFLTHPSNQKMLMSFSLSQHSFLPFHLSLFLSLFPLVFCILTPTPQPKLSLIWQLRCADTWQRRNGVKCETRQEWYWDKERITGWSGGRSLI